MQGWKAHEDIDVDFADCQLDRAVDSDNEQYIKSVCRKHLQRAGTFVQLIGEDTARKHKYVRWEAEVAIEKECRIIAVNLDDWRDLIRRHVRRFFGTLARCSCRSRQPSWAMR